MGRGADRSRGPIAAAAAGGDGPRGDPHLGHDRHAEGRETPTARLAGTGGGAVLEDPAAGARDDGDRGADVPLVGLCPLHAVAAAGLDAGAAAALRPRADARGRGAPPRNRARRRAGDAAADHGAAGGDARTLRHGALRVIAASRLGAARRAGDARDGHVRRGALQPLRLDRGRVGDDRHPRGSARGAGHRRPPAARDRGEDARRGGPRAGAGAAGADLRRERDGVRRLHRRRRQGDRARPDAHRRHGPHRRARDACSWTAATTR